MALRECDGPLHLPRLSAFDLGIVRSPGPGLGNLLFPIARALIGQRRWGGDLVHPTMRQIKFGTFLRGERDKRTYSDIFRARTAEDWRTWARARGCAKVREGDFDDARDGINVVYEGLGRFFHNLAGAREVAADWINANAAVAPAGVQDYDIGIHVRLGGFGTASPDETRGENVCLPFGWYREALEVAKTRLGHSKPRIRLFTDGDGELVRNALNLAGQKDRD